LLRGRFVLDHSHVELEGAWVTEVSFELQACGTAEGGFRTLGAVTTCFGKNFGLAKRRRCCKSIASCEGMASLTTLSLGQFWPTRLDMGEMLGSLIP
jgi:hypothetical protein